MDMLLNKNSLSVTTMEDFVKILDSFCNTPTAMELFINLQLDIDTLKRVTLSR